jgi:hypothetical protein
MAMVEVLWPAAGCPLLMAVLDLCSSQWQWAAVAMRARVVMAVPVRKGLRPFWSVELMAVEMAACISWLRLLCVCVCV